MKMISKRQIKITKNLDSQKIQLHWASAVVARIPDFHMKMKFQGAIQNY